MESVTAPVGLAVVGAGYWGPDLVRNAMSTTSAAARSLALDGAFVSVEDVA
jgi:hypothetical protein